MSDSPNKTHANRVGVFGGTFDPVHNGHIAIAEAVRTKLELDRVLLVVAADQWLREDPPVASAADRLHMVELAVANVDGLEASDVDIARKGSTYTVDTLTDLREQMGDEVELSLIVGSDSAMTMDRWRRAEEIRSLANVVTVGRPGIVFHRVELPESHPANGAEYVEGPMIDVSATRVRDLVRGGDDISAHVHPAVAEYIESADLYR